MSDCTPIPDGPETIVLRPDEVRLVDWIFTQEPECQPPRSEQIQSGQVTITVTAPQGGTPPTISGSPTVPSVAPVVDPTGTIVQAWVWAPPATVGQTYKTDCNATTNTGSKMTRCGNIQIAACES